jgi:acetyl-CoA carboxylase beta subunit
MKEIKCQKCRQMFFPDDEEEKSEICPLCNGPLAYDYPSWEEQSYMKHEAGMFMTPEEEISALNFNKNKKMVKK